MNKIIWLRYFIEAQGYNIAHNRLRLGKKIAILLETMTSYLSPIGMNPSKIGTSL